MGSCRKYKVLYSLVNWCWDTGVAQTTDLLDFKVFIAYYYCTSMATTMMEGEACHCHWISYPLASVMAFVLGFAAPFSRIVRLLLGYILVTNFFFCITISLSGSLLTLSTRGGGSKTIAGRCKKSARAALGEKWVGNGRLSRCCHQTEWGIQSFVPQFVPLLLGLLRRWGMSVIAGRQSHAEQVRRLKFRKGFKIQRQLDMFLWIFIWKQMACWIFKLCNPYL